MLSVNTQTRLSMHAVCQSLHCSRTYTKWVYIWPLLSVNAQTNLSMRAISPEPSLPSNLHIPSVNAQTRLSMRAVSPEPSLLSHMQKLGVHMAYSFSQYSDETKYACSLARAFTAFTRAQTGRTYGIFHQSMLIGA